MLNNNRLLLIGGVVIALVVIVVVVVVLTQPAAEEEPGPPPMFDTPEEAAAHGLEILQALVTADTYEMYGFESAAEAQSAALGEPFEVHRVSLEGIRGFNADADDPGTLLFDFNRWMYPVTVDGDFRSAIAIELWEDGWSATDFGGPNLMQAILNSQESDEDIVVHIAALNLFFTARETPDGLTMTPVVDDPGFQFTAARSLDAAAVFDSVQPAAEAHEGDPS
jgi:hypothetical protein